MNVLVFTNYTSLANFPYITSRFENITNELASDTFETKIYNDT